MHKIFNAFGSDYGFVCRLVSRSPQFYSDPPGIELPIFLQLRNGAEEGLGVAFDWIQQTHVHEANWLVGDGKTWEQILKIPFVITI